MISDAEVKRSPNTGRRTTQTGDSPSVPRNTAYGVSNPYIRKHDEVLALKMPMHLFDLNLKAAVEKIALIEETNISHEVRKAVKLWVRRWEIQNGQRVYAGEWPKWVESAALEPDPNRSPSECVGHSEPSAQSDTPLTT